MGIQGNKPHIFLWDLYGKKFLKKFFFDPTNQKFGTHKKMTLNSQAKTQPPFPQYPFFNHFLTLKEYDRNKYFNSFYTL